MPSPSMLTFPKTVELEQRLARAELTLAEQCEAIAAKDVQIASLRETVGALSRQVVSLQAQLDHVFAKDGRY